MSDLAQIKMLLDWNKYTDFITMSRVHLSTFICILLFCGYVKYWTTCFYCARKYLSGRKISGCLRISWKKLVVLTYSSVTYFFNYGSVFFHSNSNTWMLPTQWWLIFNILLVWFSKLCYVEDWVSVLLSHHG